MVETAELLVGTRAVPSSETGTVSKLLTFLEPWVPPLRKGFTPSALPSAQDPVVGPKPTERMPGKGACKLCVVCVCVRPQNLCPVYPAGYLSGES